MPQEKNRRSEVLHWDHVYGQFAVAAAATPIEDIDRELAARGFHLDKLRGAVGRLGRHGGAHSTGGEAAASPAFGDERLPPHPLLALRTVEHGGGVPQPSGTRRWWAAGAVAGVVGAAIVGMLVLPVSEGMVAPWSGATVAATGERHGPAGSSPEHADAGPPGTATSRSIPVPRPDKTRQTYYGSKVKAALLKRCAAKSPEGLCSEDKLAPAADELGKKGKAAGSELPEPPPLTILASANRRSGARG